MLVLKQVLKRNNLFISFCNYCSLKLQPEFEIIRDKDLLCELDFKYLCDTQNTLEIKENIKNRKGIGDVDEVIRLFEVWQNNRSADTYKQLINSALKIPNKSHPDIRTLNEAKIIKVIGEDKSKPFKLLTFEELSKKLNICRTENISNFTGSRSYYLLGALAELEQAIIDYALVKLKNFGFELISVPDILPRSVIENCGMETRGKRNQVYSIGGELDKEDLCLSGTAEMGIAYFLEKKIVPTEKLPLRIASVSRCFRAETSAISEERGIYRVHQFTKVEMFGVSHPDSSEDLLNEFLQIEEDIFSSFGLTLRILDMPPKELGAQAYRKFDIESWFPGKSYWGELSSTSNCIDYQSRRLNIKSSDGEFVHTVNGTACAVPRLIIALMETYQNKDGSVQLPSVLAPFMERTLITANQALRLSSYKSRDGFG